MISKMKLNFLDLNNQKGLINEAKLFKLKINQDQSGVLVETLKNTWSEVYNQNLPFAQAYYSVTPPGLARDENLWHCHPTKQVDRFVIIKGNAVLALYDWRRESKTFGVLNLFLMGEKNSDENQFLLLIPKNVLHGFLSVGPDPCYLLNYPTSLYDKMEEGRIPFAKAGVTFEDSKPFSWALIREAFK